MTQNDKQLIDKAYKTKIWMYRDVYNMIPEADTEDCKWTLKKIADFLMEKATGVEL